MVVWAVILISICTGCAFLIVRIARKERDDEWHYAGEGKMRRRIGGKWQYRAATREEAEQLFDTMAW